jgi:hypothetical protein
LAIDYTKENYEQLTEKFDVVYDAVGKTFVLNFFVQRRSSKYHMKLTHRCRILDFNPYIKVSSLTISTLRTI